MIDQHRWYGQHSAAVQAIDASQRTRSGCRDPVDVRSRNEGDEIMRPVIRRKELGDLRTLLSRHHSVALTGGIGDRKSVV